MVLCPIKAQGQVLTLAHKALVVCLLLRSLPCILTLLSPPLCACPLAAPQMAQKWWATEAEPTKTMNGQASQLPSGSPI